MRGFTLFVLMVMAAQVTKAQLCFPVKKVYAYVQPVTKGNAPKEERKGAGPRANHLVFLVSKEEGIQLNHVWINGELHAAELKEISSPVQTNNVVGEKKQLVPATKKKTYQLLFTALPAADLNVVIPKKHQNQPLVLELQFKKKKKYIAVANIETLETLPLY